MRLHKARDIGLGTHRLDLGILLVLPDEGLIWGTVCERQKGDVHPPERHQVDGLKPEVLDGRGWPPDEGNVHQGATGPSGRAGENQTLEQRRREPMYGDSWMIELNRRGQRIFAYFQQSFRQHLNKHQQHEALSFAIGTPRSEASRLPGRRFGCDSSHPRLPTALAPGDSRLPRGLESCQSESSPERCTGVTSSRLLT